MSGPICPVCGDAHWTVRAHGMCQPCRTSEAEERRSLVRFSCFAMLLVCASIACGIFIALSMEAL